MLLCRGLETRDNASIALTIGNFDGVHVGHQALLAELQQQARQRQLQTAVMVFEPHPLELFVPSQAPTRLTTLREKLELFNQQGLDRVYVCRFRPAFANISPEQFVALLYQQLRARYILIGDDFRFGRQRAGDFELLQQQGQQLGFETQALHSVLQGGVRVSSTAIRQALSAGQLDVAAYYLGRHYTISGRVSPGDQLGRQLGFPTANIPLKHNRPPLSGIFVVQAEIEGIGLVNGVASIGVRPTVKQNARPLLEVYLFNFSQNIYGRPIRVAFLHKLRDEAKYPDLASLTQQIRQDVADAERWFASQQEK